MKTYSKTIAANFLAAFAINAQAATYLDSTGENFTTAGGGILDISSVEVNHTATDLIFKVNVTGNPTTTDWGKYMIGFNTVAGGDNVGNGWNRPIALSGMDYWVGSWVDSGNGAEIHKYTASWGLQSATYSSNPDGISVSKDASSATIQFKFAGLGLAPGSTFSFDVYTSGGGGTDGAVDALSASTQSIADWGNSFVTTAPLSYTIAAVPEPTSLALLGIGASLIIGRIRRP